MRGKRILFCDADPKMRRVAERALNATGSKVETVATHLVVSPGAGDKHYDLYMLGFESHHLTDPTWLATLDRVAERAPRSKIVLHTSCPPREYLPLMEEKPFLCHLIAKNETEIDPDELIITAEKLLREDFFGLEKYLLWGVEPLCLRIEESMRKQEYLDAVADYAMQLGCKSRSVEMIETVADELVTNAVYNAPRTPDGKAKYGKLSRREPIVLKDHEVGELRVACDGAYIAIAQIDPFGALTRETVISYLSRCSTKGPGQISDASGGAGIGLFRVFQSLSKLVINIEPGRRTEVITLIDLRLNMRRFRQSGKSFHLFIAREPQRGVRQEPTEAARGASL